jgi:hypothetical protein
MELEKRRWLIMEMSDLRYSSYEFSFLVKVMSGTDRKISSFEQIFRMAGIISERFRYSKIV